VESPKQKSQDGSGSYIIGFFKRRNHVFLRFWFLLDPVLAEVAELQTLSTALLHELDPARTRIAKKHDFAF
jgi:hypothetical protein